VTESPSTGPTFEEIYRELAPAVVGYLRAHGVDDPEAVTQEVFIAVLPKIGTISGGEDGVRTLLYSIAHARAVDHHRRTARTPHSVEYDRDLDARLTASAEDLAVKRANTRDMLSVLSTLNDDQREVLLLRVVADLPLEHVASVMGRSVGAVKQLQRRALLTLKEHPQITDRRPR
jgi:RNA polymerase sigma-70 factor (ECF subfamily)